MFKCYSSNTGFPLSPHLAQGGSHQEFKGVDEGVPAHTPTSSLRAEGGLVTVPTGPGLGVEIDPAWVARARVL
jgi:L-alanine-DL-glutamate epimerase-like enolase superfamily enzyme